MYKKLKFISSVSLFVVVVVGAITSPYWSMETHRVRYTGINPNTSDVGWKANYVLVDERGNDISGSENTFDVKDSWWHFHTSSDTTSSVIQNAVKKGTVLNATTTGFRREWLVFSSRKNVLSNKKAVLKTNF